MIKYLPDFSKFRIGVFGDVMLDQYWHGSSSRISPEAPVPVVQLTDVENRPGGAANVANNIAHLGAKVSLMGFVGKDNSAETLESLLTDKVKINFMKAHNCPTIRKLRILSQNQQLVRVDTEKLVQPYTNEGFLDVHMCFHNMIQDCEVVVLSDYNKGALTNPQHFIKHARGLGKIVIVDPKKSNIEEYQGADLIKANHKEFTAMVGACASNDEIIKHAQKLIKKYDVGIFVVTLGSKGMIAIDADNNFFMEAKGNNVFDVTGAGDTVIAVIAAGIAANLGFRDTAELAALASGISVSKVGTTAVTAKELQDSLNKSVIKDIPLGPIEVKELLPILDKCQDNGEKIVFANGCYDVLHFGHTRFLEKAKQLGDRLVVGINSDASVKRLKGDNRPQFSVQERMEVLSSLSSVDWVVVFDEETPGKIVESICPDILVKGDEKFKRIEDIPKSEGVEFVKKHGGEVKLISRTAGCSSSAIINDEKKSL
ncbi:MAG: bifunctional D-glycero-beta-D-manno-heptose-7-phosphate kinase/D-glycero-beta-D-manno-heptose 1-phosphate adenylyltransferase HldE [Francisellaceae bacterium]|jgi:D-beta-D-heptose 7-phosphate kinase / D-beta-D-heptose 1-phosphate adenosyltransferase|nr:bifunctional D-glycero-beta-D-manno-heptose-7-phosphate kinase/D-glycero-beta-D-manno-heptose 1-phosphate adenylyltransferase HldE [Francisellaceae bacterium]MBT6207389.1 bifunctional D-glycero-beta-D-manno-heptose-7-phosphate kinase/D-glycero-beta-D-manno-heptose 1-phosphate adenylyltransferase HldE [Francisellaceae bacterium]MBT6539364.1 bifunctional D-glycero-beta-D-manno-heptose-7-phosphate kinase/D-glycero-beta-D-manno-heptose 1-phosphate adenylyltransferase HldE [Francisellaceae bacteriu